MASGKSDPKRDDKGRFGPGNKANPGGRPRALIGQVRELAQKHTISGVEVMARIIDGDFDAKPTDRVAAWKALADRALGKPMSYVELTGADESPVQTQSIDPSKLTTAQLRNLLQLLDKAKSDPE